MGRCGGVPPQSPGKENHLRIVLPRQLSRSNAIADPSNNLGTFDNNIDVDGLGLGFVKCVKIVNALPTIEGGANGIDVDAVEALHSVSDSVTDT